MPRYNEIINNFINGETSPKTYGRTDSEIYKRSCRTLKNMIVLPQGGASRRTGAKFFLKRVPTSDDLFLSDLGDGARIIPFVFDQDESYLLIFNKFQASGFNENQISYIRVNNEVLNWCGMNNLLVSPSSAVSTTRTSGNLITPRTNDALQNSSVLAEMQYAQAGSYLVFTHESFPPFIVARTFEGVLAIDGYFLQYQAAASTNFGPIPFMDLNLSDVTITASAATVGTGRTLTASANMFDVGHIGTMFCFQDSGTVGIAIITAFTSATVVTAEITRVLPAAATSGTKNWYEGAWSTYRGFPRTVAYWNSALYFGGSPTFPDRLWKSQDFDIFEMANERTQNPGATATASDPFFADLAVGTGISKINGMLAGSRDLVLVTNLREYAISSFTRSSIDVKPQTGFGSEYIQPILVEDTVTYIQRGFRKIRYMMYEERRGAYVSPDLTYLAEHMPRLSLSETVNPLPSKIKAMAYQVLDNGILWVVDNNGFLFACTKDEANTVLAFHRHDVGGKVISIAALPTRNSTYDDVWMVVERVIDGSTVYRLEKIGNDFSETSLKLGIPEYDRIPVFTDSSKVIYRTGTASFFARLNSSASANFSDGVGTATVTNTATFSDWMRLGSGAYVNYPAASNVVFPQAGCVRLKVSRGSGTLFSISESVSSSNNLIRLRWGGSNGNELLLTIKDSAGSNIINDVSFGAVDLYDKGLFLVELNYDITNGVTRIFVNGAQIGATNTSTGTRDTSIGKFTLGANFDNGNTLSSLYSNLEVYSEPQNTASYEVSDTLPFGREVYDLDYLEGEEVAVTANGNYVGDFTVASGQITIPVDYEDSTILVVGKKYSHVLETQAIDVGSGVGSSIGSITRIDRAVVRFNATAQAKVGPSLDVLEELIFRSSLTPADEAIDLVTDDKEISFLGGYGRVERVFITGSDPLPCNVTCLSLRGITADI